MMKAPLHLFLAICTIAGAAFGQAPSLPTSLGAFGFTADRLGPGTVTLVPEAGGPAAPYPTIQAAVNAAVEGDTVLLPDGLFYGKGNRDIVVEGKNLTIRSENGPEQCVIDCQRKGRGFLFLGPLVTQDTLLRGVSIVRGDSRYDPVDASGGGIRCSAVSRPTIEDCVFAFCESQTVGGAIYHQPGSGVSGVMRDCLFQGNFSLGQGGAFSGGDIVIERCTFIGNRANGSGGAVDLATRGTLRSCLILGNEARPNFGTSVFGGGIYLRGASWKVENCTIVGNSAVGSGGGLAFGGDLTATVSNNIFWGNTATNAGSQAFATGFFGGGQVTFRHCAIEGGAAGVDVATASPPPQLISIVDEDPRFVDQIGGNYALQSTSPCIDAGDPAFAADMNEGDHDNEPRLNGLVDIGADEAWPGVALSLVSPGRAGETNRIQVNGARAGAYVWFFFGGTSGDLNIPFGACSGLTLEIVDAGLLGVQMAGAEGRASYAQFVPSELSAMSLLFQTVAFNPLFPGAGCSVSNLVPFTYP